MAYVIVIPSESEESFSILRVMWIENEPQPTSSLQRCEKPLLYKEM